MSFWFFTLLIASISFLSGCSRYHESQGYMPLSKVPNHVDMDPLPLRAEKMKAMKLAKEELTTDT